MANVTMGANRPTQLLVKGRLIASTALTGVLAAVGIGGAALAQDVVISSTDTVTAPIDMDSSYPGGGTLLLEEGGGILVTSDTTNAVSTGAGSPWTFEIDGTLSADGNAGGISSHADDTVIVGETGVLESTTGGSPIYTIGGVTVENSGRISGDTFSITVASGDLSLTNNAGATIEGTVQMSNLGTGSFIDNSGSIAGRDERSALHLTGDSTIYNRDGATLDSDYSVIVVDSGVGYLENAGSITSTNAASTDTSAAAFYGSGTVINEETGIMSGDTGVWLGNWYELSSEPGTLTNSGMISGATYHGALFYNLADASLTNSGTMEGANTGAFFYGFTNAEINNSGTIEGARGIYLGTSGFTTGGHATITNTGTIEGTGTYAIQTSSGISYDLTLGTGSNLIGEVTADSGDTLTLNGTGSEDEDLKGFGSLTMDGSAWTLTGDVQADTLALTAGTLTLSGADLSFGSLSIDDAAQLIVNGSFSTPVTTTLAGGARLGGSGTVGETTVNSGGILSPGNSIGTLNVAGDVTFNAGSIYEVEVQPGGADSDLTIASGDIIINGGTVQQIGFEGTYDPNSTYRILEGGTGLTGSFDAVTSDFAFLDASLIYDRDNYTVDLQLLRNDISFADTASSDNQLAVAQALESTSYGNALFDAVIFLHDDPEELATAFDSLSGEVHASLRSGLVESTDLLRSSVNNRLRFVGEAGGAPAGASSDYASRAAANSAFSANRFDVWSQGYGTWSHKDGDGNAASVDVTTGGLLIGADMAVSEAERLGAFFGYSSSDLESAERDASAATDSYHLGLYGENSFSAGAGLLSLRGGVSYSRNEVETDRAVTAGTLEETQIANYDAATTQVFGEAGWTFEAGSSQIEPFAGLAWVGLNTDSFVETGGDAALTSSSEHTSTFFSTLGARGSTQTALGTLPLELSGAFSWRHAFGDVSQQNTAYFTGGSAFTVEGLPVSRDTTLLEAEASLLLNDNTHLSLGYKGQIGESSREHSVILRLSAQF